MCVLEKFSKKKVQTPGNRKILAEQKEKTGLMKTGSTEPGSISLIAHKLLIKYSLKKY